MGTKAAEKTQNKPVHEIRYRNLRATIWKNMVGRGSMYNVTVSRTYRGKDNAWHDSNSFPFRDLMNLAKALGDAHTFIAALEAKDRAMSQGANKPVRAS
jgi:hypothetical protein